MFDCIIAVNRLEHAHALEELLRSGRYPLEVIGTLTNGKALMDTIGEFRVDILIAEAELEELGGLYTLKEALRLQPCCAVIAASEAANFSYDNACAAIETGVRGYILLPTEAGRVERAVNMALEWLYMHSTAHMSPGGSEPLAVETGRVSQSAELAENIYQYIVENHTEPMSMADITNTFYISESYVHRLLMNYKQKSFKKILNEARIAHARRLLREPSRIPIGEIAHRVGYTDSHYFHRLYKAYYGISPSMDRDGSL